MVAATAGTFKARVVVKVIFHVVTIVEMVANNVTILLYDKVAAVGIVAAFPLLGWCHAEIELTDTYQRYAEKRRKC